MLEPDAGTLASPVLRGRAVATSPCYPAGYDMTATLTSNSGDEEFAIELVAPAEYADDVGFECSIDVRGQCWDGEHTHPFSLSVQGLWLSSAAVTALRDHISRWVGQSLGHLVVENLTGEFELGKLPGQSVQVHFGPRADTISHLNPLVSITYSAGALHGEFHFVTDQSCLAGFAQELSMEFIGSRENAV